MLKKSRVDFQEIVKNGTILYVVFFVVVVVVVLIQFYVPFKIISAHMRRANQ